MHDRAIGIRVRSFRGLLLVALALLPFGVDAARDVRPADERRAVDEPAAAHAVQSPDPRGRRVKGWVEAAPGRPLETLPPEITTLESYGERVFIELPADAVDRVATHGLVFHPLPDADLLSAGDVRIDAVGGEPRIEARWKTEPADAAARRPFLIKFDAPPKESWLDAVRATGADIVQYQPHFGLLVLAPPAATEQLRGLQRVAFAGEYHGVYKAPGALRAKADRDETIKLRVIYFDLPGYQQRIDAVVTRGARVGDVQHARSTSHWALLHYVIFEDIDTRDLPAILRDPHVYWAEQWRLPELEDERASQIVAGAMPGVPLPGYGAFLSGLGADGSGVTVAVADTGFDTGNVTTLHPDLQGRVAFANALCLTHRDRDGHGTNVASIAVGDARPPTGTNILDLDGFLWGLGVAPGASLYVQKALDFFDCLDTYNSDANTLAQNAVSAGNAQIGNHSFTDGLGHGAAYNSQAQAWDARVRDADTGVAGNQPYTVIFSAGNSGPTASSLTSPKAAKNIVTVGATENYLPGECPGISGCGGSADNPDALVSFSSRGPTSDGRIKPDVVAPGHVLAGSKSSEAGYGCFCDGGAGNGCCASIAVDGSNEYTLFSGTSQAAPVAAGSSAIVHDWYAGSFGSFPSPAMNKAILIAGAVDLQTVNAPNNNEGWGRISLTESLGSPLATVFVDQTTIIRDTGDPGAFTTSYFPQNPQAPIEATLVWTDAPGSLFCSTCLVNDLDLLVSQNTTTWRGNNLSGGFSTTDTTRDALNNIEVVRLPAGTLGCEAFEVKIRAQALGGDGVPGDLDFSDQDFALVLSNASASEAPGVLETTSSSLGGGCDADTFLDRRELADLTVELSNVGCAGAADVEATLSVLSQPAGADISISPAGPQALGTILGGQGASPQWQVGLADAAGSFCGQSVTLQLDLTDSAANVWSSQIVLALDGDGLTPVTQTDTADQDNSFSAGADWSLRSCRTTSAPTSWHMGQTDCTGIPRGAGVTSDLVFAFTLGANDVLDELSFQHAFEGYVMSELRDSIQVQFDAENDGTYVTLQTWQHGIDAPASMTAAGPFDLQPFNASRADTVKVRFRFTSAANHTGQNRAAGWDVDDIVFKYETPICDAGSCPTCSAPSGLTENNAVDVLPCLGNGIEVSWQQDPGSWGDAGGTRSYTVLRDGAPLVGGPCAGTLSFGTTSCVDTTAAPDTPHTYQVRYDNGCGQSAATTGLSMADAAAAPPAIDDGSVGEPLRVDYVGGDITLTWEAETCATSYHVYTGTIGNFWDHAIFASTGLDGADSCFEPTNSVSFADPGGSVYFVIAADNGVLESDLGPSTPMDPRPFASPSCNAHD